jgi:Uncharacterized conserved protein
MGNYVHRDGDLTTGHDCWPPTVPATFSSDVFANGRGVVRMGDAIVPHTCPLIPEMHGGVYVESRSVFVNGRPVQIIGSPVDCGDAAAEGSPDVWVGD